MDEIQLESRHKIFLDFKRKTVTNIMFFLSLLTIFCTLQLNLLELRGF